MRTGPTTASRTFQLSAFREQSKDKSLPASGHFADPPALAVEVVSPESRFRDHHTKRNEYAAFGVESYWIVTPDPLAPSAIEFRLDGGAYRGASESVDFDLFATDAPFPVKLVPHWLTADDSTWKRRIGGG